MSGSSYQPSSKKVEANIETIENVDDKGVTITDSKARLVYKNYIEHHNSLYAVITFGGIFLTCLSALVTAEFKDIIFEDSRYIFKAIFIVVAVVTGIITMITFKKWNINRKTHTEDYFIEALKGVKNS